MLRASDLYLMLSKTPVTKEELFPAVTCVGSLFQQALCSESVPHTSNSAHIRRLFCDPTVQIQHSGFRTV